MEGLTKLVQNMPALAIGFLITSMILLTGGIVMYKSTDVADDIITNTTHVANLETRADNFDTIGDEVDTTNTTLAQLVIIFALVAVVVAIILGLYRFAGKSGNSGEM
ncbi:MAG: hypothetical protein R6U15_00030 [Candidatus Izemoplasmatales bacterium]